MRHLLAAVAVAAGLLAVPPVGAGGHGAAAPVGPGLASPGVEWIGAVPFDVGGATGARVVGNRLFVAGARAFSIYDLADPRSPQLLSTTPIGVAFPNEDVDTNGQILLVNDEQLVSGELQVWDVRDGRAPKRLAVLANMRDHTFTCVLGCKYAYGSRGSIVDLRDPANPKKVGTWAGLARNDGYDVTEVAPGIVLTASRTIRLLDARRTPLDPVLLGTGTTPDNRLIHSLRWPRNGADRWFIVQGETPFTQRCDSRSGAIMTFDTRGWRRSKTFRLTGEWRPVNGAYADGSPPAGPAGCTAMWFQHHPTFRDGGLVAAAAFEHGVRLLDVDRSGGISEVGYYVPAAGSTIAAYWVRPDVLYAVDFEKGIEILTVTRPVLPRE